MFSFYLKRYLCICNVFQVFKLHSCAQILIRCEPLSYGDSWKGSLSSFTDGKKVGERKLSLLVFSSFSFPAPPDWLFLFYSVQSLESINKRQAACQHARPQYFNCTFHILHRSKWKKAAKMLNWRRNKKKKLLILRESPGTFRKPPFSFCHQPQKNWDGFSG